MSLASARRKPTLLKSGVSLLLAKEKPASNNFSAILNPGPAVDGIRRVKSKYRGHSLRDLLRHVYRKFPEMTTESEIIDAVLDRNR